VQWVEARPLFGRRIVVTRPRDQAEEGARLLEDLGADVVLFPSIAIAPPADPATFTRAVAAAPGYDWIAFTSVNGVRAFVAEWRAAGRDVRELGPVRLAAIGSETAAELGRHLLRPAVVAQEYRAEGLLDALAGHDLAGRRLLLPRAADARAVLPDTLRARGAHVDEVLAYRAVVPPDADVSGLHAALAAGQVDAITFTSSSTVRNFVALLGADEIRRIVRPERPAIACIGPVTAETARAAGLSVTIAPSTYTMAALTDALVAHFCKGSGDPLQKSDG